MEVANIETERFDIYVDGALLISDVDTPYMTLFSGKHGGTGSVYNPLGVINDGLNEVGIVTKNKTVGEFVKFVD